MSESVRIVGDLHIDKRFPYTNRAKAANWDEYRRNVRKLVFHKGGPTTFQLGDLFDTYQVSSQYFIQGMAVADKCKAVLPGNHDIAKNTEIRSSVYDLNHLIVGVVANQVKVCRVEDSSFVIVPHQLTQPDFDHVLSELVTTMQELSSKFIYILLHANFGDHVGALSENYIKREQAKALLDAGATTLFCGHEHNYSEPMQGVVMVGSLYPTNFGEMEDKFFIDLNPRTGEWNTVKSWDAEQCYTKVSGYEDIQKILLGYRPWPNKVQFIEFEGVLPLSDALELTQRIAKAYQEDTHLIAVKSNITIETGSEVSQELVKEDPGVDWVKYVSSTLTETEFEAFQCLLNQSR